MHPQLAQAEMLSAVQRQQLAALANRDTRYEVVVTRTSDGAKALLGYTARKTGAGLLALLHTGNNGREAMCFLRCSDETRVYRDGATRLLLGLGGSVGTIAFSARTERDVIMTGKPFPRCEDAE